MFLPRVRDGDYTSYVYDLITAGKYAEVIEFLRPRAEKSLKDFVNAADCYERLTVICPENNSYWLHYAQCLNKSGFPSEAIKIVNFIASKSDPETIALLKASIRYQEEEPRECQVMLEKCSQKNALVLRNQGCAHFQDSEYPEALAKFSSSLKIDSFSPGLEYCVAVTHFEMKNYPEAIKYCNEIISKALNVNPEFIPSIPGDKENMKYFRTSPALQDSSLIEAYNLKTAIAYLQHDLFAAKLALQSIPARMEEEVDMITLHNQAILQSEVNPNESINILVHIISQPSYPKEALSNLIITYFREEQYENAADFMAENIEVCFTQLPEETYNLFEAIIIQQTSPEEAYVRFEELITRYQDQLKKLSNQERTRRLEGSADKLKAVEAEYDQILQRLVPAVMSQAVIYWNHKNYLQVEKQLKRVHELLSDQPSWRTNMAHTLFMLENYAEAVKFYETIIRHEDSNLLILSPVLLANLCVSYVMTSRNDEAEDVLRRVEEAEEGNSSQDMLQDTPETKETSSHLCLINLIIGTLYCSKDNFQFGMRRVLSSFEPSVSAKLDWNTWDYAKRVMLALLYGVFNHEVSLPSDMIRDCIVFLSHCEDAEKQSTNGKEGNADSANNFIGRESRFLKKLFLSHFSP